jgi:hypothetical protein
VPVSKQACLKAQSQPAVAQRNHSMPWVGPTTSRQLLDVYTDRS